MIRMDSFIKERNNMKTVKWGQALVVGAMLLGLSACKIESNATVAADAQVKFNTTYDLSLVLQRMQPVLASIKDSGAILDKLNCKGLDPDSLKDKYKDFECKDVAAGVVSISGSFQGDASKGIKVNEETQEISVDAVALYRGITDVRPPKVDSETIQIGEQPAWLPVSKEKVEQYHNEGVALSMNLTMPGEVVSIDGQKPKNLKGNTVAVNFVDIAGKSEYVVISSQKKSVPWARWLFIALGLLLIAAAVMYLLKRKQTPNTPNSPKAPTPPAPPYQSKDVTSANEPVDTKHGDAPKADDTPNNDASPKI